MVAVAAGAAFTFNYADNLEALEAAGAELVAFDPLHDPALPDGVHGLVIGGGFPEVYGTALAANEPLLASARRSIGDGLPTWAECGGLLWLAEELDGHRMVGAVATRASLGSRVHIGYREVVTRVDTVVGPAGTSFRGQELHYSTCDPAGTALDISSPHRRGTDGFASASLLATYVHHHAGGDPSLVSSFVRACVGRAGGRARSTSDGEVGPVDAAHAS